MSLNKRRLGQKQERIAADYLIKQGYQILEHNFYSRTGEIDLIAREGTFLVFIEVKYRKTNAFGFPEEAVTPAKQRTIRNTARYYMLLHHFPEATPCRFDVIAVTGEEIRLIRNAF